jgi:hypothetical protein
MELQREAGKVLHQSSWGSRVVQRARTRGEGDNAEEPYLFKRVELGMGSSAEVNLCGPCVRLHDELLVPSDWLGWSDGEQQWSTRLRAVRLFTNALKDLQVTSEDQDWNAQRKLGRALYSLDTRSFGALLDNFARVCPCENDNKAFMIVLPCCNRRIHVGCLVPGWGKLETQGNFGNDVVCCMCQRQGCLPRCIVRRLIGDNWTTGVYLTSSKRITEPTCQTRSSKRVHGCDATSATEVAAVLE